MIMHVTNWKKAIGELCRVSRHAVMIDFPPRVGFAGLAPLVHPLIRPFNSNHQSYRVFKISEITDVFCENGFQIQAIDKHLVLPFGLHRTVNSLKFTQRIEEMLTKIGFRDLFGAPVTVLAIRSDKS